MAERRDGVPINTYKHFWDEWEHLPPSVQDQFADLFEMLKLNPYDPEVQAKCTPEADDHFAYMVNEGYAIYWKVITQPVFPPKSIDSLDGMEIILTAIKKKTRR